MKLSLTTNDGLLLEQWIVEEDFGDLAKPLPRSMLVSEIAHAVRFHKLAEKAEEEEETHG